MPLRLTKTVIDNVLITRYNGNNQGSSSRGGETAVTPRIKKGSEIGRARGKAYGLQKKKKAKEGYQHWLISVRPTG